MGAIRVKARVRTLTGVAHHSFEPSDDFGKRWADEGAADTFINVDDGDLQDTWDFSATRPGLTITLESGTVSVDDVLGNRVEYKDGIDVVGAIIGGRGADSYLIRALNPNGTVLGQNHPRLAGEDP